MSLKGSLVVIALALGLTACGSGSDNTPSTATPPKTSSTTTIPDALNVEGVWSQLVKRAQECMPNNVDRLKIETDTQGKSDRINAWKADGSQFVTVNLISETRPETRAFYTGTEDRTIGTAVMPDNDAFDYSADAKESRDRAVTAQGHFGLILDELGCA